MYSHCIVVCALNQQRVYVCSILYITIKTQTTALRSMPNIVHKHEVNTDKIQEKEPRWRKRLILPWWTSRKLMSQEGSIDSILCHKFSDFQVIEIWWWISNNSTVQLLYVIQVDNLWISFKHLFCCKFAEWVLCCMLLMIALHNFIYTFFSFHVFNVFDLKITCNFLSYYFLFLMHMLSLFND